MPAKPGRFAKIFCAKFCPVLITCVMFECFCIILEIMSQMKWRQMNKIKIKKINSPKKQNVQAAHIQRFVNWKIPCQLCRTGTAGQIFQRGFPILYTFAVINTQNGDRKANSKKSHPNGKTQISCLLWMILTETRSKHINGYKKCCFNMTIKNIGKFFNRVGKLLIFHISFMPLWPWNVVKVTETSNFYGCAKSDNYHIYSIQNKRNIKIKKIQLPPLALPA